MITKRHVSSGINNRAEEIKLGLCCRCVSVNVVQLSVSRLIPQMPLSHPDDPLDGEFGEVGRLEESHEDAAEDGDGAPGVRRHYQTDLLHERISPLKNSEKQLIGLLRLGPFVVKFHHCGLLPKLDGFTASPQRPHQRHLDPSSETSGEGPHGVVPLTVPHELRFICTVGQVAELGEQHVSDGAEIFLCLVVTELHEDQLFVSHVGRTAHHQSSFLGLIAERADVRHFVDVTVALLRFAGVH